MGIEKSNIQGTLRLLQQYLTPPDIIPGSPTGNWNSGTATSGDPGADLVTIGTANEWSEVSMAVIFLNSFTPGATITIRGYELIAGAVREVMNDDYVVGVDPDLVMLIWWISAQIYDQIRIEVHSDQAADDGKAAVFEYRIKSLEYS